MKSTAFQKFRWQFLVATNGHHIVGMNKAISCCNFGADPIDEFSMRAGAPLSDLCVVSAQAYGVLEKLTNAMILSVSSYSSFTTSHAFFQASCAQAICSSSSGHSHLPPIRAS